VLLENENKDTLMNKLKLNVLGISYSQTQSGAYALVLTEEEGERRIPIIIGGFEAQSIAIQLEGLKPPRPLTHDLFLNFSTAFQISIREVYIYKLEEGVFYSKLMCCQGANEIEIDSRTSDAIALALRFVCPIYTTEEILSKSGIIMDAEEQDVEAKPTPKPSTIPSEYSNMALEELKELLGKAIQDEDYERASKIKDEIEKKKK